MQEKIKVLIIAFNIGSEYGYAWPNAIQTKGQFVFQTVWIL